MGFVLVKLVQELHHLNSYPNYSTEGCSSKGAKRAGGTVNGSKAPDAKIV